MVSGGVELPQLLQSVVDCAVDSLSVLLAKDDDDHADDDAESWWWQRL